MDAIERLDRAIAACDSSPDEENASLASLSSSISSIFFRLFLLIALLMCVNHNM